MYRTTDDLDSEWAKLYCSLRSGRAPEGLRVERDLFLAGTRMRSLPALMNVRGSLDLRFCQRLKKIGDGLIVKRKLFIGGRLPERGSTLREMVQITPLTIDDVDAALCEIDEMPDSWHRLSDSHWCPIKELPEGLKTGCLIISHCHNLESIPESILVEKTLVIKNCPNLVRLPKKLILKGDLIISGCPKLTQWPEHLETRDLRVSSCPIQSLPDNWTITRDLHFEDCVALSNLPESLSVSGSLLLKRCAIESLPELKTRNEIRLLRLEKLTSISKPIHTKMALWIKDCPNLSEITAGIETGAQLGFTNCKSLTRLPDNIKVRQEFRIKNCESLKQLPENMTVGDPQRPFNAIGLNVTDCKLITEIPKSAKLYRSIAIEGSSITSVPDSQIIHYRGAVLPAEVYFNPEKITPDLVFFQSNSENRRLLLEMAGVDSIMAKVKHKIVDQDEDAGGERMLIDINTRQNRRKRILRFLVCHCPSTHRKYLLETPRTKQVNTCHKAAAWLAGFDNPDDYQPIVET